MNSESDTREPYSPPTPNPIVFEKIAGFNLQVGSSGIGTARIMIFKSSKQANKMERVTSTNIIISGEEAKSELIRMLKAHGRPTISKMLQGGINSRTMTCLRRYLEL